MYMTKLLFVFSVDLNFYFQITKPLNTTSAASLQFVLGWLLVSLSLFVWQFVTRLILLIDDRSQATNSCL